MNIFFLHWNPIISAHYACDKHVVKMLLESTQMLYTAYHLTCPELLKESQLTPYKVVHQNHPCTKWVRENFSNFSWLLILAYEYCKEYTFRYNKVHSCQAHIIWMLQNLPSLPKEPLTTPFQAMPDIYKCEDPIQGYRNYYVNEKLRFVKYTKRSPPRWLTKTIAKIEKNM